VRTRILGLLVFGLVVESSALQAATITYDFFVDGGDSGPLAGVTASGFFSFDDSLVPAGGGDVNEAGLLSDLEFTWNGINYDETTANTGSLTFDATGALTSGFSGSDCEAGACSASINDPNSWLLGLGDEIGYDVGGERLFFGPTTFSLRAVPEPGTLALLSLGLVGLGVGRRLKDPGPGRSLRRWD
jgi:hypothetical protein